MTPLSWRLRREAPGGLSPWEKLSRETGLAPLAARLAWLRGEDSPEVLAWRLDPSWTRPHDPYLLEGMGVAVSRIREAVRTGERLLVYGDYDVDGVTATALLVRALERLGAKPEFFIPNRFSDGYGLSVECIRELAAGGPGLCISVDCGVRSVEEVALSRELGLAWILTDHHALGAERPAAEAILHPAFGGYPNPHLAGVGVAFKLAQALLDACPVPAGAEALFLEGLLKLVALGTVADVAPLVGENAWLVRRGLQALAGRNGPGLQALLAQARIEGVPRAQEIAFSVAPRLNAVGRMGGAEDAVRLLLSRDGAEAARLAQRAEALNQERKGVQEAMLGRLPAYGGESFELLLDPKGHKGVLGIVAGRRMQETRHPVAVGLVSEGVAQCSLRAPAGYDLTEMLERARPFLLGGGGHKVAAGMSFPEKHLAQVRRVFERTAAEQALGLEEPCLEVDGLGEAFLPSLEARARLEPFGAGFPEPLFVLQGALERAQPFSKGHLRLQLAGVRESITWFSGELPEGCSLLTLAANPEEHPRFGRSWRLSRLLEASSPSEATA